MRDSGPTLTGRERASELRFDDAQRLIPTTLSHHSSPLLALGPALMDPTLLDPISYIAVHFTSQTKHIKPHIVQTHVKAALFWGGSFLEHR